MTDKQGGMTGVAPAVLPVEPFEAEEIQSLSELSPIQYREAFAVQVTEQRTPEEWARSLLEGAKPRKRTAMLTTWGLLRLKLGPPGSPEHVLGWRVHSRGERAVVLALRNRAGLEARIVLSATGHRLVHTMVVRNDHWYWRLLWAALAPRHREFVRGLLQDLVDRTAADVPHH